MFMGYFWGVIPPERAECSTNVTQRKIDLVPAALVANTTHAAADFSFGLQNSDAFLGGRVKGNGFQP
jgi:hypothetical protein